ncbi:MAG: transcriptional regulator GutM [Pasteurellaceae bacterium]|nr:transcriptional regulator GutM [Pasteurellaceae bacterium]
MTDKINALILIAIIAWLLQIILGWLQLNRFNKEFISLSKQGKVGIGKTKGRFKPKTIIAIAFDHNLNVVDTLIIKGYTVFARPKKLTILNNLHYSNIDPLKIFPGNKDLQRILSEAIQME